MAKNEATGMIGTLNVVLYCIVPSNYEHVGYRPESSAFLKVEYYVKSQHMSVSL